MSHTLRNCLVALVIAAASQVSAFTFQPMFALLDSSGQGSIQTFAVSNEGDERLAVRFSVLSRTLGSDGQEINADAGDLFTIYPERVVVEPRSSAAVKLQWKGPAGVESERPFRLIAENVALDSAVSATSGIKVMFRYVASIYVGEAAFTPDLVCTVKGATGSAGKKGLIVEIVNQGKKHVVADSTLLTIKGLKGGAVALGPKDLGPLSDANYLPGNPVRLFIQRSDAVPGKSYDARLDYEAEY